MRIEHFRYEFKRMGGFYILPETILFRKPLMERAHGKERRF